MGANKRFGTIHGLRGIAAFSVVLYHLSANLKPQLDSVLPDALTFAFKYGYLGVPIFFVISGFVIAYSVSPPKVDRLFVGNFILRRSIRLDFTYWVSIAVALALLAIKNTLFGATEMPSAGDVFLHLFYLQDLMAADSLISVVYWTLCYEVQFYLFFVFCLWFVNSVSNPSINTFPIVNIGFLLVAFYSICINFELLETPINGLFVRYWHLFFMGMLLCNCLRKEYQARSLLIFWILLEAFFLVFVEFKPSVLSACVCTLGLFILSERHHLDSLFTSKSITYLGTISYALYLVHTDIGWKVISLGKTLLGDSLNGLTGLLLFFGGIVISILVAHILHRLVESPSQKLATRLKHESLVDILRKTKDRLIKS
jgi:peptidoglycan/LPS O-acetylase OafA/YrhL